MKWIKSTAVKTLLVRSLAGPAFWLLSPISFYFQEYQNKLGYHNSWDLHLMVLLKLPQLEASWSNQWSSVNRREYSSSLTSALLLLNLCTPSATAVLVTFLSSKRCITWRLKSYLCDWLSSSNSKDEIEGRGHGHGIRQSANVAANSIMSLSKYGSCSRNVGNIWASLPLTQIFDAEKLSSSWFTYLMNRE